MQLRKRGRIWQAIFYDANGIRRFESTHCTDKRAADAAGRRKERAAQGAPDEAEDPTTVGEALDAMIAERQEVADTGKRSHETVRMYRVKAGHLDRVLERVVLDGNEEVSREPMLLARLGAADVDGYISKRRAEGAAENTIAKELVALRMTLRLMKRWGRWAGDIDAVMPIAFAPEYKPRQRFLTWAELGKLLRALTPDHAARVAFQVATSANLGETCRAQCQDLDGAGVYIRGTKRTSRLRTVPVVKPWQRELLAFVVEHAQGVDGKLFRFDGGYDNALEAGCKAAKITYCSSNDLRRTFAHMMRAERVPLELIAPCMGHADTKMLERVYGRLSTDELAALMGGGTPVAQTPAEKPSTSDKSDGARRRKSLKSAESESRTRTPDQPAGDFKYSRLGALEPRDYKRKRSYGGGTGTPVAQRSAGEGVVVVLPRTVRR